MGFDLTIFRLEVDHANHCTTPLLSETNVNVLVGDCSRDSKFFENTPGACFNEDKISESSR